MSLGRGSTALNTVNSQQGPGRPRSSSGRALTWDGRNPAVRLPPLLMEELELMSHGVAVVRRKSKVTYADIIAWLLDQCPEQVAQVKAMCPPEIRAKFLPRSGDSMGNSPPQLLAPPAMGSVPQLTAVAHPGIPGVEGMDVMQQASTGVLAHTPGGPGGRGASVHWLVPPNVLTRYPGAEGELVDGQVTSQTPPGAILSTPPGIVPSQHSGTPGSGMVQHQQQHHHQVQMPQQQPSQHQQQHHHVQVSHQQQIQHQHQHQLQHHQAHHEQQQQQQHLPQPQQQQQHHNQPQQHQHSPHQTQGPQHMQQQIQHQSVVSQDPDPEATDVDITMEGEEGQGNAADVPKITADGTGTEGEHVALDGAGMDEAIDVTGGDNVRPAGGDSIESMSVVTGGEATEADLHDVAKNLGSKRRGDDALGAGTPTEHALPPKKAKIMEMTAKEDENILKGKARKKKREGESDGEASAPKSGSFTSLLQEQQQRLQQ